MTKLKENGQAAMFEESLNTPMIIEQSQPTKGGSIFTPGNFEHAQRIAKMLSSSDLVPASYKDKIANTLIALEMSNRVGASPLMVMQNLHIIQGKPSWSSSFIISVLNACGRFAPLNFKLTGKGETLECVAWTTDKKTGAELEGPAATIAMAKAEGWYDKSGSKWKTMPELMIRYRAAAFFGRLYAPDMLMGMHAVEEVEDITVQNATVELSDERLSKALEVIAVGNKEDIEKAKTFLATTNLNEAQRIIIQEAINAHNG